MTDTVTIWHVFYDSPSDRHHDHFYMTRVLWWYHHHHHWWWPTSSSPALPPRFALWRNWSAGRSTNETLSTFQKQMKLKSENFAKLASEVCQMADKENFGAKMHFRDWELVTTAAAAAQERGQTQENVIRIEDKHSFKYIGHRKGNRTQRKYWMRAKIYRNDMKHVKHKRGKSLFIQTDLAWKQMPLWTFQTFISKSNLLSTADKRQKEGETM